MAHRIAKLVIQHNGDNDFLNGADYHCLTRDDFVDTNDGVVSLESLDKKEEEQSKQRKQRKQTWMERRAKLKPMCRSPRYKHNKKDSFVKVEGVKMYAV